MGQENFHASVQYGDMKGSAAADRHDNRCMSRYLEEQGLIQEGEILIGVEMWSGEVHGRTQDRPVFVKAVVATGEGYDNIRAAVDSGNPLHVRKIDLEMPLDEFFGLFKRFAVTISTGGIIEGRDITFDD
jgi:hypothetical protein